MTAQSPTLLLTQTRIVNGVWEGVLTGMRGTAPVIEAWHQDRKLDGVRVAPVPGQAGTLAVAVPIPPSVISEGVQTIVLRVDGEVLAQVTLVAGVPLEDDLRAEISLLRAELDLLKRAFRRHCAETGS
jgi:hypothetical protein